MGARFVGRLEQVGFEGLDVLGAPLGLASLDGVVHRPDAGLGGHRSLDLGGLGILAGGVDLGGLTVTLG